MWPACATDPNGLGLLRAAVANPLDRTPRLVLTDWLQDQGEEEVAAAMRESVGMVSQASAVTPGWRAFPEGVLGRWAPWNVCADGWPGVNVRTRATGPREEWPVALPPSAWLTALRLNGTAVTDAELEGLAPLPNLTTLGLRSTAVTDAGLPRLAAHAHLATLDLGFTRVTDAGLGHLAGLPALKALDLCSTRVTDAGLERLAVLAGLTALDLSDTGVSDAGLEAYRDARPACAVIRLT
jgi:uncharacterized protein (TIGR02996 family)